MTVGLPGTGIGGLFYLLSAFAMPIAATIRTLRDSAQEPKWRVVLSQLALASAMLGALAGTGMLIDYSLAISASTLAPMVPSVFDAERPFTLGVVPTFITLGVLGVAIVVIEAAGAVLMLADRRSKLSRDMGRVSSKASHVTN